MKKNTLPIFATRNDIDFLLQSIELQQDMQFVRTGMFDQPTANIVLTLRKDADLGVALYGDQSHEPTYLVGERGCLINVRPVPQHGGGTKYVIDQQINPKTVVFRSGGVFKNQCVIAGYIGTISEDPVSNDLFRLFNKEIKRQFEKIKSYYVGKEAAELLVKGWRLTTSADSPEIYDLKKN